MALHVQHLKTVQVGILVWSYLTEEEKTNEALDQATPDHQEGNF